MYFCMGGLYHYIVACTYLGNGTGHRTVTMAAPLLVTSSSVRYEAVLHNKVFVFMLYVYEEDCLE